MVSPYILPGLKFPAPIARPHEETIDKVLDFYKVTMPKLKSPSRKREIVLPRHVAMCALYVLHRWSFKRVGDLFNRDHTTVIHAVQAVKDLTDHNDVMRKTVSDMFPSLIPIMETKKDYSPRR